MTCDLCNQCLNNKICDIDCAAVIALKKVCNNQTTNDKEDLIRGYAKDLDLIMYEIADDLKILAETLIEALPELRTIRDYNPKISYLRSHEQKKSKGKTVFAECRIIKGIYTAYLPFDFIITFYNPSICGMTDNQLKILMLHELKHIGVDLKGFMIIPHDIEDFSDIITRYGMDWNGYGQDVPDILANKQE